MQGRPIPPNDGLEPNLLGYHLRLEDISLALSFSLRLVHVRSVSAKSVHLRRETALLLQGRYQSQITDGVFRADPGSARLPLYLMHYCWTRLRGLTLLPS